MSNIIGIDVSKVDFYASFNEQDQSKLFQNDKRGIKIFEKYLNKNNFKKDQTIIGLESTGIYHLPLSHKLTQAGFTVKVINPLITKKQNQTTLRRVKNDCKDASLVRYCTLNGAGYEFIDTPEMLTLKSLVRLRDNLSNMKNVLNLQQKSLEYKEKNLDISVSKANHRLNKSVSVEIEKLEKELKEYRKAEQKLLQTIPGVGPITAVSFISEVGNVSRFPFSQKLIAYIGLDSRVHKSGTSINGKGYISKRGNKILRTRLYNACSVAVLRPNIFQDFFQKKRSEEKTYKVALVATMHKMANVIYAVWKNNTPFQDRRGLTGI